MPDQVSLLFAVEDPRADEAPSIASLVRQLDEERDWSCGEIACVNEIDEASVTQPGDEPIWTLGGALTLTRPTEDVSSERAQLEDVEALVLGRRSGMSPPNKGQTATQPDAFKPRPTASTAARVPERDCLDKPDSQSENFVPSDVATRRFGGRECDGSRCP
jgi:hypothetical protein